MIPAVKVIKTLKKLFNELNNEEVYYDILKFLEIKVGIEPLEVDED